MEKNNIRRIRIKRGMTLKELAERSGISSGYLSHLENGSRDNPSKEVMENIAIVLNSSIAEVFFPD